MGSARKAHFDIMGKGWVMRVMPKSKFERKHGKTPGAITHTSKRYVDVSSHELNLELVVHELVHAYLAEMAHWNADHDESSLEEVFCDLMALRGREILELAERLHAQVAPRRRGKASDDPKAAPGGA